MKRKLIKQGKGALTISVPKQWADFNELKPGQEISVNEEDNRLIVEAKPVAAMQQTSISLNLDTAETYRSLIGALYRGGYDAVNIHFSDKKVIPNLQKSVDSLYGLELFDITEKSCIVRNIYQSEATDVQSHVRRMIHTISTMQGIIKNDVSENKYNSKEELLQLRDNVLKQRDLIIRIIKKQKLINNAHFPYYNIAISLWSVARNYYQMYLNLDKKHPEKSIRFLEKTNAFFSQAFSKFTSIDSSEFISRNKNYQDIRSECYRLLKTEPSIIVSFCLNIILSIQLADSSIYLLNH